MPASSDTLVIGDLGIRWPNAPAFCADFLGQGSPVMEFSGQEWLSGHGIRWCPQPGNRLLTNDFGGILTANGDWSQVHGYTADKDPQGALALAAICARLAAFDGLLIHGSLVDYAGSGILFTGPSGIGKTTQAELWHSHLGADIINGDKVLLRCLGEAVYGYGLPWRGSSPYCLNRRVELKAVVVLRQAGENRIRRLTDLECMEHFLPHIFLPRWDEASQLHALDTVDRLLGRLPVYLLQCRPDTEAVELTLQTLC